LRLFALVHHLRLTAQRYVSCHSHVIMKLVTYTATPDLDRFPERERFSVWRSTHKRLMRSDPHYQRRVRGFRWRILGTTIPFVVLSLVWVASYGRHLRCSCPFISRSR
jgi:hypothetical protein